MNMPTPHLVSSQSSWTNRCSDDSRVRRQLALVRSLVDALESIPTADFRGQLAEELARLGCEALEAAAAIAAAVEEEQSRDVDHVRRCA